MVILFCIHKGLLHIFYTRSLSQKFANTGTTIIWRFSDIILNITRWKVVIMFKLNFQNFQPFYLLNTNKYGNYIFDLRHREEGKWMKMNPAAAVLENDDPRVDAVVVMYASTTQLQRGIYILHNRDIFHFLKCHILCSSMSVIYIKLATPNLWQYQTVLKNAYFYVALYDKYRKFKHPSQ